MQPHLQGTYDMAEDMTVNTAIGSPLLSRFDLVLLLLDTKNKVYNCCIIQCQRKTPWRAVPLSTLMLPWRAVPQYIVFSFGVR